MVIHKYKKNELPIIEYEMVTNESIANLLLQDLYGFVYVYKNKKIYSVLTKDDLPITTIPQRTASYFIHHVDSIDYKFEDIKNKFKFFPQLTRLAVIYNGEVLCEYRNEEIYIYDVIRNITSLRYVEIFKKPIEKYFLARNIKNVLIISNVEIFNLITRNIS